MSKIRIDEGDYTYNTPEGWKDSQMVGYMPAILAAGKALLALDKELEAIPDEGISQYHDGAAVSGIVLSLQGVPWGVVMYLDDVVQFVPLNVAYRR